MMTRIVANTFIDAVAFCCIRHNLTDKNSLNQFKVLKKKLGVAIDDISKDAGIPSESEEESKERIEELQNRLGIHL